MMGSALIKLGFMMLLAVLMFTFLNQMPDYMGDYANYIALTFFIFMGVMIAMLGDKK